MCFYCFSVFWTLHCNVNEGRKTNVEADGERQGSAETWPVLPRDAACFWLEESHPMEQDGSNGTEPHLFLSSLGQDSVLFQGVDVWRMAKNGHLMTFHPDIVI